jgi:hypothetical protein
VTRVTRGTEGDATMRQTDDVRRGTRVRVEVPSGPNAGKVLGYGEVTSLASCGGIDGTVWTVRMGAQSDDWPVAWLRPVR